MFRKRFRISTLVFTFIVALLLGFTASYFYIEHQLNSANNTATLVSKVLHVHNSIVKENFIQSVDDTKVSEGIVNGYLDSLGDPRSFYISKDNIKSYQNASDKKLLNTSGIIHEHIRSIDGITVTQVIKASPADAAGLQANDVITYVDGKSVKEIGYYNALNKLVLADGYEVNIKFDRDGAEHEATLKYLSNYTPSSVDSLIRYGSVVFIRISYFDETTFESLQAILSEIDLSGYVTTAIILDLRNNSGGSTEALSKSLDLFLPSGVLFTVENYKNGIPTTHSDIYYSDTNEVNLPVTILINENTASEAEVFALVMREYDKASTLGVTSRGNSTLQKYFDAGNETGLILTSGQYKLSKTDNFEGVGVTPVKEVALNAAFDFNKLDFANDNQLHTALEAYEVDYTKFFTSPDTALPVN